MAESPKLLHHIGNWGWETRW